jgi:plasmid stability protein
MRTTIDLPNELMQAAKVRAAQRGESLKELFTRAITREVEAPRPAEADRRVEFPLIRSRRGRRVNITNADIEDALAAEDAARYSG